MRQVTKTISTIISIFCLTACGTQSATDKAKTVFGGWRYQVQYTRAADLDEWVPVRGTLEYWIFQAGVFREIGSGYVAPQFFDDLQACNGTASGSYVQGPSTPAGDQYDLTYDGISKDTKGQCPMSPRSIFVTLQPSGAVDILDSKIAYRLNRVEQIQ
jgi:hypothetical protein